VAKCGSSVEWGQSWEEHGKNAIEGAYLFTSGANFPPRLLISRLMSGRGDSNFVSCLVSDGRGRVVMMSMDTWCGKTGEMCRNGENAISGRTMVCPISVH